MSTMSIDINGLHGCVVDCSGAGSEGRVNDNEYTGTFSSNDTRDDESPLRRDIAHQEVRQQDTDDAQGDYRGIAG